MDGMEKFTIPTHTSVVTEKSSKRLITLSAFSPDLNVIRLMHFAIKFSIPISRKYLWSIRTPKHFIQQIKYHYFRPIGKQINGVLIGRKILFRKWLDFQRNRLDFDSKIKKKWKRRWYIGDPTEVQKCSYNPWISCSFHTCNYFVHHSHVLLIPYFPIFPLRKIFENRFRNLDFLQINNLNKFYLEILNKLFLFTFCWLFCQTCWEFVQLYINKKLQHIKYIVYYGQTAKMKNQGRGKCN